MKTILSGKDALKELKDKLKETFSQNVNESGVDIQSTNIHLAADNGVLSVTAGSWPVLTIDNSSE